MDNRVVCYGLTEKDKKKITEPLQKFFETLQNFMVAKQFSTKGVKSTITVNSNSPSTYLWQGFVYIVKDGYSFNVWRSCSDLNNLPKTKEALLAVTVSI